MGGRLFRWPAQTLLACAVVASVMAQPAPAPFVVDTPQDQVDADLTDPECVAASTTFCTLRAAIQQANAHPGPDEIRLLTIKHTLDRRGDDGTGNNAAVGDLDITDDLTITGQATGTAISTIDAGGLSRIFHVHRGRLTIKRIRLMNGDATSDTNPLGGAFLIEAEGAVTIADSLLEANEAARGAGIFAYPFLGTTDDRGTVMVQRTTVAQSTATADGGGIVSDGRDLAVVDSIVTGNTAVFGGGLLVTGSGNLTLERSTVSGNKATEDGPGGGGLMLTGGAQARVINTTFSGNSAAVRGGAVFVSGASARLESATILKNTSGEGVGGAGVHVAASGTLTLDHVLLAKNGSKDCSGSVESLGYNLIETIPTADCTITGDTGTNRTADGLKIEEELKENANPLKTPTHALLPKSSGEKDNRALDAGGTCPDQDQRGFSRAGAALCDIGAFEYFPDTDGDGVLDAADNCPKIANADQADADKDGIGDVCDKCPTLSYLGAVDDFDGVPAQDDCCPRSAPDIPVDGHGCNLLQECDCNVRKADCGLRPWKGHREWRRCIKRTIKSVAKQECVGETTRRARLTCRRKERRDLRQLVKANPESRTCGSLQASTSDPDGDGTPEAFDNCPGHFNRCQANTDEDGRGDACDDDDDDDGLFDWDDNCPTVANAPESLGTRQADADLDGVGDVCDLCPGSDTELDPEDTNAQGCSVGETPGVPSTPTP